MKEKMKVTRNKILKSFMYIWEQSPIVTKIQISSIMVFIFIKEKIRVTNNKILKSLICFNVNLRIKFNLQNDPKILKILVSENTPHEREYESNKK
jgi:hypothetical protein